MPLPLDNITVLDLTKVLAGPFCTMQLADFGARVIKIEPPSGDDSRGIGPHINGESTYFISVNRNKKSITLNLKSDKGVNILKRLIPIADVLVENYRPGTMEKLGLSYEAVSTINPSIIYASGSGFGQTGPYRQKPAYDAIVQSMGGIMSVTGSPGGEPTRIGVSIGDLAAGLYLAQGIMLALYQREKTGVGQHVDVAMLDCQIALLENHISRYLTAGQIPQPMGNRHHSISPFGTFATGDGYITIACGNNKLFEKLCSLLEKPYLTNDPLYATNVDRVTNNNSLTVELEEVLKKKTVAQWCQLLDDAGIPNGPIYTVPQVIKDSQVNARGMIVRQNHPAVGTVGIAGIPVKLSQSPGEVRDPAPLLGQHTGEILKDYLKFTDDEIELLKRENVI